MAHKQKIPVNPPSAKDFAKSHTADVLPEREERIRIRAYELYEARNREPGHEEEDWFKAEAEVTSRKSNVVR